MRLLDTRAGRVVAWILGAVLLSLDPPTLIRG